MSAPPEAPRQDDFSPPAAHSMDTDWFGVDRDGYVAVFNPNENGFAPVQAIERSASLRDDLWPLTMDEPYPAPDQPWPRRIDQIVVGERIDLARLDDPNLKKRWDGIALAVRSEDVEAVTRVMEQCCAYVWSRLPALNGTLLRVDADSAKPTLGARLAESGLVMGCWSAFPAAPAMFHYIVWELIDGIPYERSESPPDPLKVEDLPSAVKRQFDRLGFIELPNVSFRETQTLQPAEHVKCAGDGAVVWYSASNKQPRALPGEEESLWGYVGEFLEGQLPEPKRDSAYQCSKPGAQPVKSIENIEHNLNRGWLASDKQSRVAMFADFSSTRGSFPVAPLRYISAMAAAPALRERLRSLPIDDILDGWRDGPIEGKRGLYWWGDIWFRIPGDQSIVEWNARLIRWALSNRIGSVATLLPVADGAIANFTEGTAKPQSRDAGKRPWPGLSWRLDAGWAAPLGLYDFRAHENVFSTAIAAPYERFAAPLRPVMRSELPAEFAESIPVLPGVDFDRDKWIQPLEWPGFSATALGWLDRDRRKIAPLPGAERWYIDYYRELQLNASKGIEFAPPPGPQP